MSYLEILWLVMLVIVPFLFVFLTSDGAGFFVGIIFVALIGGISHAISVANNEFKITHQHELTITYSSLDDNSLNIIDDEYKHYNISDYSTIQKYKNGRKFYKTYYYKKCFGPDELKMDLVMK